MTLPAARHADTPDLDRLMQVVTAVTAALDEEAAALADGSPEVLMNAVAGKRQALRALEALSQDPAVASLLTDDSRRQRQDTAALIEALQVCESRNLAVGGAIASARRGNEFLLRALGQQPQRPAYSARGETHDLPGQRILGSA